MKTQIYAVLFLLLYATGAMAEAAPKIAFVSAEKILAESAQAKAVEQAMTTRFGSRKESLQAAEQELKKMEDEYKRNELVMTNDKLEELKKSIIGKYQLYNQQKTQLSQEITQMRNQELSGLISIVKGVIDDIAKEEKYDFIIRGEAVLYGADKYDITDRVIEKMNKKFKKDKG